MLAPQQSVGARDSVGSTTEGLPVHLRHDLCRPQMGALLKLLKHGIESGEDPLGRASFDDVSEARGQTN